MTLRPFLVVLRPPRLEPLPGISQGQEPGGIEALRPQAAVERLDVGVVRGLPWTREVDLYPFGAPTGPASGPRTPGRCPPSASSAARAVAPAGRARRPRQTPEIALGAIESASRVWASITARIRIGRPSNSASATKSMLQTSFGATALGRPPGSARPACARHLAADRQPFLSIEAVDAFRVHGPTLSPEQNMQPPVAIPDTARGQITQPHPQFDLRITPRRYRCDDRRKPVAEHARRSPTP